MLLYIHIPFCRRKCTYCAFFSQKYREEDVQDYLRVLEQEIRVRRSWFPDTSFSSIYLGGGTPTVLPESVLDRIFNAVHCSFILDRGCEFTIEANPENIQDKGFLRRLGSMGINRISLGVQSLDDELLNLLGRGHDAQRAGRAARMIRETELFDLSLDLIWGLPGQTLQGWLEELRRAADLEPQHLSCYGLSLEPGTRLASAAYNSGPACPGEDILARMYLQGVRFLESRNFLQYEISNFARPGHACRHNQGYWSQESYLGLGPSAVSTVQGFRWRNPSDLQKYRQLEQKSFPREQTEVLTRTRMLNEMVMLSLRTSWGMCLEKYKALSSEDICSRYPETIRALQKNRLIKVSGGQLCLTRKGMLVSNSILEILMQQEKDYGQQKQGYYPGPA